MCVNSPKEQSVDSGLKSILITIRMFHIKPDNIFYVKEQEV